MSQLSTEELVSLTEAKLATRQMEVLKQNRIPFFVSARGRPVTTWEAVNQALSGGTNKAIPGSGVNLQGLD